MRKRLRRLAIGFTRAWTRAYTSGMPSEARRRRRAEIESDIWESLHDSESTDASGLQIVVRVARGMPADVLWRFEYALAGGQEMWRKLAFLFIATAALMVMAWSFSPRSELQLPKLPAKPIPNYVERRRMPPPPPPPPPTWDEFVAKVNGRVPQKPDTPADNRR